MKRIVLFDPSYGTSNLGDFIINDAVMREMAGVFDGNFVVRYSTHNPVLSAVQLARPNAIRRNCAEADLKFIGGTNILKDNLVKIIPGWNINFFTAKLYTGSICIGAGRAVTKTGKIDAYTRSIYARAFSPDVIHSVRDEKSREFLETLGFQAINTGCPTTWALTPELTRTIRHDQAGHVVATFTDYSPDVESDSKILNSLLNQYQTVSVWVQGVNDLAYLRSLRNSDQVRIVSPTLEDFKRALMADDTEYVGTRLHAGIFAMQQRVRSTIIAVDNRARDMAESIGIHVVERAELVRSDAYLVRSEPTELSVKFSRIADWKGQFVADV